MSEFAPNISSPAASTSTGNAGVGAQAAYTPSFEGGLTRNVETQTAVQKAEVVFESTPETLHPINEPISFENYRDEKVASGLLKDAGTYGFKGALERLAAGETGQEPVEADVEQEVEKVAASDEVSVEPKDEADSAEQKVETTESNQTKNEKPAGEKPAKSEADKSEEETPEEKAVRTIEQLTAQLKQSEEEKRALIERQRRTDEKLQEALGKVNLTNAEVELLKTEIEKLKKEIEELKKKRMGLFEILAIIGLTIFGEGLKIAEAEATEQPKAA